MPCVLVQTSIDEESSVISLEMIPSSFKVWEAKEGKKTKS